MLGILEVDDRKQALGKSAPEPGKKETRERRRFKDSGWKARYLEEMVFASKYMSRVSGEIRLDGEVQFGNKIHLAEEESCVEWKATA